MYTLFNMILSCIPLMDDTVGEMHFSKFLYIAVLLPMS